MLVSDCKNDLLSFTPTAPDFNIAVTPLLDFSTLVLLVIVSLVNVWPSAETSWDADDIWFLGNVGDLNPENFIDC